VVRKSTITIIILGTLVLLMLLPTVIAVAIYESPPNNPLNIYHWNK